MAPVAFGVEIAQIELVLRSKMDRRRSAGDLAGDESLAANRALVIEQDAVGSVQAIGFAIIDGDPIGVEFGRRVRRARVKRRRFVLRSLSRLAVELGDRGLVEARRVLEPGDADRLQQSQGSDRIGVGGVFGGLEAHLHMRLGG